MFTKLHPLTINRIGLAAAIAAAGTFGPTTTAADSAGVTIEPAVAAAPVALRPQPAGVETTTVDEPVADLTVPVTASASAQRLDSPELNGAGPITSPDVGDHCAEGLGADQLTAFFAEPIGPFQGADYQRAIRLADDRVLWTFQDAFISGTLVHNVGMIQSGRCFTLLNSGARSWLFTDQTSHMHRWHWILAGTQEPDGSIHLFVVELNERGAGYLGRTEPTALRRVQLDPATLGVTAVADEPIIGVDLYGWSIVSDDDHTYLYSHCYRQFGFAELLGVDPCAEYVKVARVPRGALDGPRQYWSDAGWVDDPSLATPVIDRNLVGATNNPAQIHFDGERFHMIQKRDDWWGEQLDVAVADNPHGPFVHVTTFDEQRKCELWVCNTYFATWVPWDDTSGASIWMTSHNRWNGSETASHLHVYRPTFHTLAA